MVVVGHVNDKNMTTMRRVILLFFYLAMILVGAPMAFAWIVFGGRGIIFSAGGFIAAFGAYLLWTDFLSKERL